jgi:hypothetical protein
MDFLQKPPQWLNDALPDAARDVLQNGGWYAILGVGALVVLLILWAIVRPLFRRRRRPARAERSEIAVEDLASYPPPAPSTGDRRLTVEGVPVRLRLVVLAPAGVAYQVNADTVNDVLEQVLTGLGSIAAADLPRVRVWPAQLSYEGFANTFHRNTPMPEGEKEPSRWVLVAGRARMGGQSLMVGLGMQAIKPTTVGRKTLQPHEWSTVLRIKVRD